VPAYLAKQSELKAKGISEVIVYCVNDMAVMEAWAKDQGIEGSMLKFMGDPTSAFTKALGVELTHAGPSGILGSGRCKRFALLAEDGVIKGLNISESPDDPTGDGEPSASMPAAMMKYA